MNFNKRLIIQFIMQHVFVLVTLLIAVVTAFTYLIFLVTSTSYEPNIPDAENFMIARYISSEDGNISLKAEVKDLIKEKNDWIQVVEENGKVLYHFNTPNDVPTSYTKTSLFSYIQNHIESPYTFTYWEIELEKKRTCYLRRYVKSNVLLKTIQKEHPSVSTDSFALTEEEKQLLSKEKATLQIFNSGGEEVFSYPDGKKKRFLSYKLLLAKRNRGTIKKTRLAFTTQIAIIFSL